MEGETWKVRSCCAAGAAAVARQLQLQNILFRLLLFLSLLWFFLLARPTVMRGPVLKSN